MYKLLAAINVLDIPVTLFGAFGFFISGIWLGFLGEWGLIGKGLFLLIAACFCLGFALMPGMIFAIPAIKMTERNNPLGYLFGFLNVIFTLGVLSTWCILILLYFVSHAHYSAITPALIWSYSVGIGPVVCLAMREKENPYSAIASIFLGVAYMVTIIAISFFHPTRTDIFVIFGITMTLCTIVQTKLATSPEL